MKAKEYFEKYVNENQDKSNEWKIVKTFRDIFCEGQKMAKNRNAKTIRAYEAIFKELNIKENSFCRMVNKIDDMQLKRWFYEFKHGHPFLLSEETDIIVETRLNDRACKWMDDNEIQELVKLRVKAMYEKKFPNAKRWSLPVFNCI